jgi:threonyl-tRNA synthetase
MDNKVKISIDGKTFDIEKGTPIILILKNNGYELNDYVFAEIEGKGAIDLKYKIEGGENITLIDKESPKALEVLRHSAAHLMAQAVTELFPDVQVGVGPAIENGFYYDFYKETPFTPQDIEEIEKKMKKLRKKNYPIERIEVPKVEAVKIFKEKGQTLKVELIEEKSDDIASLYKQGDFIDFCRGPHLPSTGKIKHFKLLYSSAAYWKGDENNLPMQRIYGTVFFEEDELNDYLKFLEEAKKRDHRKLGKELELFMISDRIGPGLILWLPKGAFIRRKIEDYWIEEHYKAGYELLNTPHIAKIDLWETSGHLSFYKENMFPSMEFDNSEYQLKPMNCPFHIEIYQSKMRSYRDFPIRWAELGTVYRYERSGVLHGLLRVRGFTQDDAHIFSLPKDLNRDIEDILKLNFKILKTFGFDKYAVYLSTKPDKAVGTPENWQRAEDALKNALEKLGIQYEIDPGEGVFYGPKIDIKIKDMLGRAWQCSTIQVDFNLPERFNISYIDEDGTKKQPIMIHRALMGSFERFFGVLIENYGGKFPLWVSPTQLIIIPVSEKHLDYANKVKEMFAEEGIRVKVDSRNEKLGYKIRSAELDKIPYMAIVGEKEEKENNLSIRIQGIGDYGNITINDMKKMIQLKVKSKSLDYDMKEVIN